MYALSVCSNLNIQKDSNILDLTEADELHNVLLLHFGSHVTMKVKYQHLKSNKQEICGTQTKLRFLKNKKLTTESLTDTVVYGLVM